MTLDVYLKKQAEAGWSLDYRKHPDQRAQDGIVADGWRKVRKGGVVKFASAWWTHPELKNHVDQFVYLSNPDYWMTELSWFHAIDPSGNGHVRKLEKTKKV